MVTARDKTDKRQMLDNDTSGNKSDEGFKDKRAIVNVRPLLYLTERILF